MIDRYDLIVIGTGTAASVAASQCRSAGWRVAVIDYLPFGGTCALRGCDPKKVLVGAAEALDSVNRLRGVGVFSGDVTLSWAALQRFKRGFTDPVPARSTRSFIEQGIATYRGKARFSGQTRITVGGNELEGRYILIAAGAEPARLAIEGSRYFTTSDEFLELEALPPRILFIGGGYIGFEFAHAAARAGARAEILNRGPTPLQGFDPDLVKALVTRSESLGIGVHTRHQVTAVEQTDTHYVAHASTPEGPVTMDTDMVVHSGGRVPAVADLDLAKANITHNGTHIALNDYLQSLSNPSVYVAGDATGGPLPLTPVASIEGRVAAENLLQGNHLTVDYTGIPTIVYTVPALARVGLLEHEAREQGRRFRVMYQEAGSWYTARRVNEPCYAFKVLVEEDTDRILGAHVVGPEAAETVNLFGLAMRAGLRAEDLKRATFAYPTGASDLSYMLP